MGNTRAHTGLLVAVGLMAGTATAGTFAGTVRSGDGEPLQGVRVRFTHDASGVSESVFTDPDGAFHATIERNGTLQLRLRTPYYRDVEVDVDEPDGEMAMVMEAMTTDQEISNNPVAAAALEGGVLQVICIDVQPAEDA